MRAQGESRDSRNPAISSLGWFAFCPARPTDIILGQLGVRLAATRTVRYELSIIDTRRRRKTFLFFPSIGRLFDLFLGRNAVARSPLSQATKSKLEPFAEKVEVRQGAYTVAGTSTNQAVTPEGAYFSSAALAQECLAERLNAEPALAGTMHVIESLEAMP